MENKTTVNEMAANRRVITRDGVVMPYAEYLEMVRSERNQILSSQGKSPNNGSFFFYFREIYTLFYEKKGSVNMLQAIIGAVIIASSAMLIHIQEAEYNKEYKKNEETDWNEYYAQI